MRAMMMCLALAPLALAADDAEPELKLAKAITMKDLQGGFAGFAGQVVTIEPSGILTTGQEAGGKLTPKVKAKIDAKTMTALVKELKKYDAATLKTAGEPTTNPRTITIIHGDKPVMLHLPTTGKLPAADVKDPAGRIAGVVRAIQEAVNKADRVKD